MPESNGNGSAALKIVCGVMSGILGTVLFMWLTFPKDLATNAEILSLTSTMQQQVDKLSSRVDAHDIKINHLDVQMGRVTLKAGIPNDEPGDWQRP